MRPAIVTGLWTKNANLAVRRSVWAGKYGQGPSSAMGTGTLTLVNPVSYRVFQRNTSGFGDIAISGTYTGTPGALEASFNGGAWSIIEASPSGNVFSGTLTGQAGGQGTLSVRWRGNPDSVVTRTLVGVGDLFIVGGQSNACGMAEVNQTYSHATLKACMLGNDYTWKEMADPLDSNAGQVDAVSADAGTAGSCWMRVATLYMASQGVPCAFVPCAKVGTQITVDWGIPTNHQDRTTLYGSMVYRGLQTGAKVVLWWQGESDAVNGMSQADYNTALDTLAAGVVADLGVKLMPCTLEAMNDAPWNFPTQRLAINAAITTAWGDNGNILAGADLSSWDFNGIHYSAADASGVGDDWWTAVRTAFGWSA